MIHAKQLKSQDKLTQKVIELGIEAWEDVLLFAQNLPYGRNTNRDWSLVLSEMKGTCSSKHAFLKELADQNQIPNVDLIIGMYKMNAVNTPGIGSVLIDKGLDYLAEAHCYLKVDGLRKDFTNKNSDFKRIEEDILTETNIQPDQVVKDKVKYHKNYVQRWIEEQKLPFSFDEFWDNRESCIRNLSKNGA